jgi:hypothetical protein
MISCNPVITIDYKKYHPTCQWNKLKKRDLFNPLEILNLKYLVIWDYNVYNNVIL